jgi:hypothetical protein
MPYPGSAELVYAFESSQHEEAVGLLAAVKDRLAHVQDAECCAREHCEDPSLA